MSTHTAPQAHSIRSPWELEAMIGTLRTQLYADMPSLFPHMSYEQGVLEALRWVLQRAPDPLGNQ